MKKLSTNETRQLWIDFWKSKNHMIEPSQPLVPINDNSLLWINSGVATLKKYFDGTVVPDNPRIANAQKCLRTNDIENVGVTARHHTFFEMLGNFSIGDYFKEDAVKWGYEFLTSPSWLELDVDKLYFTIHPNDKEAEKLWLEVGIKATHIVKLEENFWEIGQGPGGPNTEIFYDRGEKYNSQEMNKIIKEKKIDGPELFKYLEDNELEHDRFLEIWNIVFSEFDCKPGEMSRKDYKPLPKQNIDTGMGLERMVSVLQDVETNYDIDVFSNMIKTIDKNSRFTYQENPVPHRKVMDHARALTFAIADGAIPSNEGRGYVLRRILRSATMELERLGIHDVFLATLVDDIIDNYKDAYPNLKNQSDIIKKVITTEEKLFLKTLQKGLKRIQLLQKDNNLELDGKVAFEMYDTYGFPPEILKSYFEFNQGEFEMEMEKQRERARSSQKDVTKMASQNELLLNYKEDFHFVGYEQNESKATIKLILDQQGQEVMNPKTGETVLIITDESPFYAESGGQIYDTGTIIFENQESTIFSVQKTPYGQFIHSTNLSNNLKVGDKVLMKIDTERRKNIIKNHSATHLLHRALKEVIGENTNQAGSLNDDKKLRFDFNAIEALTSQQLEEINIKVMDKINAGANVEIKEMTIDEAKKMGAQALFGEKYGNIVRVVKMDDSIELCGGCHVTNTHEIEKFYILSESSTGSGIRRIEAITGDEVTSYIEKQIEIATSIENQKMSIIEIEELIKKFESFNKIFKIDYSKIISKLNEEIKKLEEAKKLYNNNKKWLQNEYANRAIEYFGKNIEGVTFIESDIEGDASQLREVADLVIEKIHSGVVILHTIKDEKISYVVKVSSDLKDKYSAKDILSEKLEPINGRGGGNNLMAQGGGERAAT